MDSVQPQQIVAFGGVDGEEARRWVCLGLAPAGDGDQTFGHEPILTGRLSVGAPLRLIDEVTQQCLSLNSRDAVRCQDIQRLRQAGSPFDVVVHYTLDKMRRAVPRGYELRVDPDLFAFHMQETGTVPHEGVITRLLQISASTFLGCSALIQILEDQPPLQQDLRPPVIDGWNPQFKLLPHQVQAFRWFEQVENLIQTGQNYLDAPRKYQQIGNTPWWYCHSAHTGYFVESPHCPEPNRVSLPYRGGILADDSGTGKGTSLIAYLAATRAVPGTPTIPADARGTYFPSSATLLVVPYHLPSQWLRELTKFLEAGTLQVVTLLTAAEFDTVGLDDLLTADLVLTTPNFLRSTRYLRAVATQIRDTLGESQASSNDYFLTQPCMIRTATRVARRRGHFPHPTGIPLEAIWWRRLVYDQIHLLFQMHHWQQRRRFGTQLASESVFGLTGSPNLSSSGVLAAYAEVLGVNPPLWTPQTAACLVQTCFAKFRQAEFGALEGRIIWVNPTPLEKRLNVTYSQASPEDRVKIATFFNVVTQPKAVQTPAPVSLRTIDDTLRLVCRRQTAEVKRLEQKLQSNQRTLASTTRRLATLAGSDASDASDAEEDNKRRQNRDSLRRKQQRLEAAVTGIERALDTLRRQMAYFQREIRQMKPEEEEVICPLCFVAPADTITECGHRYCLACINRSLQTDNRCPECRQEVRRGKRSGVYSVQDISTDVERLYGSKTKAVLQCLRTIREQRQKAVVFVQWPRLMQCLYVCLTRQGFKVEILGGNTYTRAAVVDRFHQPDQSEVLLVGLDQPQLQGLDLTSANHVLFVHLLVPLPGQRDLGRLRRHAISTVWRLKQPQPVIVYDFLTTGTIEETKWRAQQDTVTATESYLRDRGDSISLDEYHQQALINPRLSDSDDAADSADSDYVPSDLSDGTAGSEDLDEESN